MRMRTIALLVLASSLVGCGFQLRGANVLPGGMEDLFVVATPELRNEVEVFLQGSDTRLVEQRDAAAVVLNIVNPRYDRRVLSVDPATGKEREIELSYAVDVSAVTPAGGSILVPQTVTLVRDFVFDPDAVIGSSREEIVLRTEMMRDTVQQVLYRLRGAAARAG